MRERDSCSLSSALHTSYTARLVLMDVEALGSSNTIHHGHLPEELLEDIFAYWAYLDEDAVWMASMISRKWRRIILGCPSAWSRVYVSFLPKQVVEEYDPEWCIEEDYLQWLSSPRGKRRPLSLWVERAGDLKLSLSVTAAFSAPAVEERVMLILRELQQYFPRFEHLSLVSDTLFLLDALVTLFGKATNTWRTMYVAVDRSLSRSHGPGLGESSSPGLPMLWNVLNNNPGLREITLQGCFPTTQGQDVAPNLTHLNIKDVECHNGSVFQVLPKCPNLTNLHLSLRAPLKQLIVRGLPFDIVDPEADTDQEDHLPPALPDVRVPLNSLTNLSLHNMSIDSCKVFFQCLYTPNLLHLSLRSFGLPEIESEITQGRKTYDIMAPFGDALLGLISQTSQLKTFHACRTVLPDRHLLKLLEHMQKLTELRLVEMTVGTLTFRGLARATASPSKNEKPVLCPSLEYLHVVGCDFVTDDHIVDVVRARDGSSTLRKLSLLEVRSGPSGMVTQEGIERMRKACSPSMGCVASVAKEEQDETEENGAE